MVSGWTRTDKVKRDKWRLRRIKKLKIWHLAIIFVIFATLSLVFLRMNNLHMAELRQDVQTADKTGDIAQVDQAAERLRNYVIGHMNTDTGRISLQTSYNNAVEQAFAEANKVANNIDSGVYNRAAERCKPRLSVGGYQEYARCVAEMVGVSEKSLREPVLPNSELFYLSFAAPVISFDLAGTVVIISFILFIIIIIRVLTEAILRIVVKKSKTLV